MPKKAKKQLSKSNVKDSTVDSPDSTKEKKSSVSIVQEISNSVVKDVIQILKPDMDLAIQNKFEEIKKIMTNEIKDLRSLIENRNLAQGNISTQIDSSQAHLPKGVEGLMKQVNPQTSPKSNPMDMFAQIAPIIQALGIGVGESKPANDMGDMLQQAMTRKFLADISRNDYQSQAITNHLFKNMLKQDPDLLTSMNKTDDVLMNPLKKYGEQYEAEQLKKGSEEHF
jgi:hypothetical protein